MSEEPQKNLAVLAPVTKSKRVPTLYFIVGFKFAKGLAALLLAVGAFSLSDNDLPEEFRKLLAFFHLDPEKRFFQDLADQIAVITPHFMLSLGTISGIYCAFMFLQAIGLMFRVSWAVWLVIIESGFFIPIEVFELVRKHVPSVESHPHLFSHPRFYVAIVLVVNVIIVWYLFRNRDRIIKHHHHQA